jgi:hypothetical protein
VGKWDKKPAKPLFSRVSAVPLLILKLGFVPLFWDFLSKMSISLKESYESDYWLRLLYHTDYLNEEEYELRLKCTEIYIDLIKILFEREQINEQ